jgi:hypothetical protein
MCSGAGECPQWAASPGRLGCWPLARAAAIVVQLRCYDHKPSYSPMHEPCLAPPIGHARQEDKDHATAPLPVSPNSPPDPSPAGLGESCVPPASG